MLSKFKQAFFKYLLFFLYVILSSTWKINRQKLISLFKELQAKGYVLLIAHFHGDEWSMVKVCQGLDLKIMVSPSQDGGLMTFLLQKFSYGVVRGSSSRGGIAALLSLIRIGKQDRSKAFFSLAVDGPKGPVFEVKPGIVSLAQNLKPSVIIGVVCKADRTWLLKTWDKTYIPKPFAQIDVGIISAPIFIEEKSAADLNLLLKDLQAQMSQLKNLGSSFGQ